MWMALQSRHQEFNSRCDDKGRSLLHYAALLDLPVFAQRLLRSGMDPLECDDYACTPLHFATFGGFVLFASVLLKHQHIRSAILLADCNG